MQERQVTVDRTTYDLSPNFTVFATQNPIEYEGTYALPEAQKDRFMLKIRMDVPDREEELNLAQRMLGDEAPESVLNRGGVETVVHEANLPRLARGVKSGSREARIVNLPGGSHSRDQET